MAITIVPNPISASETQTAEAKKGLGYLWPEIPPATANKIRELAKAYGYSKKDGPKIIVNMMIEQAITEAHADIANMLADGLKMAGVRRNKK